MSYKHRRCKFELSPVACLITLNSNNYTNDWGMIAMAFLARDRYRAIKDPVKYMSVKMRPGRQLAIALLIILLLNSSAAYADIKFSFDPSVFQQILPFYIITCCFRTIYLTACLFRWVLVILDKFW